MQQSGKIKNTHLIQLGNACKVCVANIASYEI
jgi:hypothetical protein